MSLAHIPLDQITEAHLIALIAAATQESRTTEFKRESYGRDDTACGECLADISSLANTAGGDLIIGIDAADGVASALVPFTADADAEILRLEQMAASSLQPRLSGLSSRAVPITDGGAVIVLRVPQSFSGPHRVARKNTNRFWARASNGKFEPDVEQLRVMFTAAPSMQERIRNFHSQRLQFIVDGRRPIGMQNRARIVAHVIPLNTFGSGNAINLAAVEREYFRLAPIGTNRADNRLVNLDGVLTYEGTSENGVRSYVQAFRDGSLELVRCDLISPERAAEGLPPRIYAEKWSRGLVNTLQLYSSVWGGNFSVAPPVAVVVSLLSVEAVPIVFAAPGGYGVDVGEPLDRDPITFSDIVLNEWPVGHAEAALAIRPILDGIANAGGRVRSPVFDDDGKYIQLKT